MIDFFSNSQGTKGLTMFYLETRNKEDGKLNGIKIEVISLSEKIRLFKMKRKCA